MKRSMILSVVAIVLLALFCGLAVLLLLLVFPLAWFFIGRQEKRAATAAADQPPVYQHVDEVTARFGEPDDVVTLDASRANELDALVLFFTARDAVVIAGRELKLSELTSVTAKNMATPYTVDEWAVMISTRNRACPTITLRVGYDGHLAFELAAQIDKHIHERRKGE